MSAVLFCIKDANTDKKTWKKWVKIIGEDNKDNCHGKDSPTSQITIKGEKNPLSYFSKGNLGI